MFEGLKLLIEVADQHSAAAFWVGVFCLIGLSIAGLRVVQAVEALRGICTTKDTDSENE